MLFSGTRENLISPGPGGQSRTLIPSPKGKPCRLCSGGTAWVFSRYPGRESRGGQSRGEDRSGLHTDERFHGFPVPENDQGGDAVDTVAGGDGRGLVHIQ